MKTHQIFGGKIHSTITPSALSGISPQGGRKRQTAMRNDIIHNEQKNANQASRLDLTNTSPSPFRGKLEAFRGRFLTAKVQEEICPKRWVVG
jgi:hypothetical protein